MNNQSFTILGGGIAGLTTAIALQKQGISATIYEASPQIASVGAGLGIAVNALMAFERIDLAAEVIQRGRAIRTFSFLNQHGKTITQSNFKWSNTYSNLTIHRADLHALLLSKINPATIYCGKRLNKIENTQSGIQLYFEDDSIQHTNYLIVADGIHSAIRQKLMPDSIPRYAGYTCWRSVIDYPTSINWNSSETMGKNGRFGIVPLANNKVYWFACINADQRDPKFKNYGVSDLLTHFKDYHTPIPEILLKSKDENLIHNDILDLKPLNQFAFGRIVLIGDAAHATTPNMGQGACQAIEDAVILANNLTQEPNVEVAFKNFEQSRIKRTKWIIENSWKLGKVAQLENPLLIQARNSLIRIIPKFIQEKQLKKLNDIEF